MKHLLKNYFTFNQRDKNAFLILILLLFVIIIIPFFSHFFYKPQKYDFTSFREEVLAFELEQNRLQKEDSLKKQVSYSNFNYFQIEKSVEESKLKPFKFNPNNLPLEQWKNLGLTDRQINGIKNYEAKGGRFYIKSDFKKLYVISETEYEILEPYIDLPVERVKYTQKAVLKDTLFHIEINNADSSELKKLKGIGNVLSKRIVYYRNKLGGFYKKEQLLEVEGIDTVLFKSIEPFLTLEKRLIKQISVNTAEFNDLKGHPYISNNVALSIINYRNMHGKYHALTDLMKSALITEELFIKITPYLTL